MPIERARDLRKSMSGAERLLWHRLRGQQLGGHRFRRQHPIGPYIADFICLGRRLVVEVDGSHHAEPGQCQHDERRTKWLESEGYRVVRFWTIDVHDNIDSVLARIVRELERG